MISGILASPGIAFGKALLLKEDEIVIDRKKISADKVDQEVERFLSGRAKASAQLEAIKTKAGETFGEEKEAIFEGHIMLLEDEELEQEIIALIKDKHMTADAAAHEVIEGQATALEELDDEYLKERAADVRDIGKRLLRNILGLAIIDLSAIQEEVILVAADLTPSETAQLNLQKVLGFITDAGGRTSHTSIMARSLELPAIVGTGSVTAQVKNGDYLILDAVNNQVYVNPTNDVIEQLRAVQEQVATEKAELAKLKDLPAITLDGHQVEVCANIGTVRDVEGAERNGAEGVGLYRTEFLFMDRDALPTEEEQFAAYKAVAEACGSQAVIVRTMDIGGDKELPYMNFPKEENPFLGWRAVRIAMDRKEILRDQVRAILRASAFGKLRIMFPMIISVEEVRALRKEIEIYKQELRDEGKAFDESIEIGVMVETPAAATIARHLAKEVDFFSIGTNDLTQYTLAVDRGNDMISHLYQPMSPSVLNLIKQVIDASHAEGKWTGMCGELAGDERATLLLLGMDLDEFSMSAISIPRIKKIIRNTNFEDAKVLAEQALAQPTTDELMTLVNKFIEEKTIC
ncbi:TPA_asm: phosphoenolpyruvate-protein phosphotransferase PtsI [Salmonella enterica subsp. enterica serovar Abortusovis]|uniref:Phosphoenolpyruvate-protein phosphotransferase n=1 Tax=Salmonella enterica subsp. enterica serovar Abortusovis TaxID=53961 RepID=A0A738AAS7_SALET|nr:phosphoenolpyruvate-protein phosphotransferase PtsI [Salmonella enterica subsp. enterica serovar Javiana]EED9435612.1 phosphoenolpyruvate-protein phosphotransferase PtsI [Salmonella enterica subsp. enterica]EEH6572466.1 phosphoenolpyruvate-protein phosphotransferase PtsI [Salmonella enterica]HAC6653847.1 phosphoenolpyruvate-protein phosphotransferase PtsI [Salmonella enterica subsp. enterica serovar Abortusovis]EJZ6965228.1 phosphoenolpyruvate-protein phosphotransferase PtsI [Salmonella ente